MKYLYRLAVLLVIFGLASCRDIKKEEAESKAAVEQIEAVEEEAAQLTEELDEEGAELDEALKDLDSI